MALNLLAIVLTFSRGAWLALGLELLVLAYIFHGKKGLLAALAPVALIGIVFIRAGFFLRVGEAISPGRAAASSAPR